MTESKKHNWMTKNRNEIKKNLCIVALCQQCSIILFEIIGSIIGHLNHIGNIIEVFNVKNIFLT
jgi:hypothetical protein